MQVERGTNPMTLSWGQKMRYQFRSRRLLRFICFAPTAKIPRIVDLYEYLSLDRKGSVMPASKFEPFSARCQVCWSVVAAPLMRLVHCGSSNNVQNPTLDTLPYLHALDSLDNAM